NGTVITNFPGLSTDFHTVRLEFDPPKMNFHIFLDGSDAGIMPYVKKAMNDDRYATIASWGAESEFKYVRVGLPIAIQLKFLPSVLENGQITLNWAGNGLLEWAPTISGPWTAITPAPPTPYSEPIAAAANRFYRLKANP
ncbi:MAG: hypothetical protein L0Z50_11465, partial [Verrucomicrobiales bacterium]|nr:hypothetical protein [Verrucomicrobiales bacterium]